MKPNCELFQQWIPQALLSDLGLEEKRLLESHLSTCAACRQEKERYLSFLPLLNKDADLPVPKHFFINPAATGESPWTAFTRLSFVWRAGLVAAAAFLITLGGLMAAKTRIEVGKHGIALALGQSTLPQGEAAYVRQADLQNMRRELTSLLQQKSQSERLEFVKLLKEELTKTNHSLSSSQQQWVLASLKQVENRLDEKILSAGTIIQTQNEQALASLSNSFSRQREKDMNLIETGVQALARRDSLKNEQTDAILDTLIQVAELKMVPTPSTGGK
jgi:hypothetical protein